MSKSINQQVFYDPTGKRWRLSLSLGLFIGIILLTLISLTINNVFRIYSINSTIRALTYDSQRSKNIQRDIITNYTYTYEEYVSFKEQSDIIDQVFFNSARPELQDGQINLITKSGEEFERIHKFINDNTPSINSNLQISDINYDKKYYEFRDNSYTLTTLINNQKYHSNFIKQIKKHILDQNYSGVSLSFREITFADIDKNSLYSFIEELDSVLPQSRINLSIPTEADISKVKQVISKVDSLTIQINPIKNSFAQTKDLNQIDQNVQKLLKEFSNLPVSLMISSDNAIFTYQNNELISNQPISYSQIGDLISKNGLKISSDENQPQKPNYLEYSQDGYDFKIVLTDSVYHYNTLHLLDKSLGENVTAIGYSDLGFEDPLSWDIINTNDINVRQEIIQKLKFNTFIDKKGIGDIVTPSADPVFGERKIEFQDNLAVHQEIITLPKNAQAYFTQANSNSIALTFDDGPDPIYTPQILDILKEYDVKATFFVIGQNVAKYPEITNRIIEEGHIIGNHTYTHPKTYTLEETVLANEIKATQNIVQEVTGVTPRYFRIPFSDLTSLDTEKDLTRYNIAQDQGLISAEYNVDSKDWELNEKQKILDKIFSYDHNESSQVLLHDGGNNRQSTIEALPEIIERLRSQGINLVTVEEADTTNNPVENTKNSLTIFSKLGFLFQNILVSFTSAYFLLFLAFVMARYILLWLLNILSVFTKTAKKYSPIKEKPLVSILIACYNEEQSIQRTIQSVLDSTYKNIEIVVINDGSKDKTLNILQSNFSKNHKVQIISLLNGGKAKAINRGLKIVKGEFVLSIDADTLIYPDTLSNLLSQFNPQTGAVAGNIQVGNDANLLTKNQRLEYILGQNFDKIAFQTINSIMVIPGALGMWRLEAIKQSGGYQTDTLAEDADLTIRLIKNGWKIKYTKNALAITEAPDNISSFIKQRVRWMYGTLQVIFKHKEMLFNKKFGYFGFVVIPEFILTYFFLPIALVSNLILLFLVAKVVTIIFEIDIYFGSFFENSSLAISIILFFVFMFLYSLSVAIAIYREQSKNKWELLLYIPFNILVYRQMLWLINIWVIIKAIKGRKALWNHFEKKGEIKLLTTTKNKPNNLLSKIKKVYKNWSKKYS